MTANAQKAMTGLLKAMIVLAVLLFVPAWSLRSGKAGFISQS